MKNFIRPFLALALAVLAAGCANPGLPTIGGKTPAQIAAQVCPPLQVTLSTLSTLALEPKATIDIGIALSAVDVVCQAGATVNVANLQTLTATGLPAIVSVIKASPLSQADQDRAVLDLSAVQIILSGAIAAAQVPAAAAAPASAASGA